MIEVVLNCSYAYFKLSTEAQLQIEQMVETPSPHTHPDIPSLRFEPKLIKAIKELGPAASDEGSLLQIFRIHPLLFNFVNVKSKNGFEKLVFHYDQALEFCLRFVQTMQNINQIHDYINSYLEAINLQADWFYFDTRQNMGSEGEIIDEESDSESEWECDEY
jgi:hypothetical protein